MISQLLAQRETARKLGDFNLVREINAQLSREGFDFTIAIDQTLERSVPKPKKGR